MPPSEFGRDVAADHQEIGAELLHDVELAFGALDGAFAPARRHALEVAERLQGDDVQPELACRRGARPPACR